MERTLWFSTDRGDRLDVVTGTFPFVSDLISALADILGVPKGKESHLRLFLQSDTPLLPCDLVEDVVGVSYGWNPRVEGSRFLHVLLPPAVGSQRDVGVGHRIRAAEQARAERPGSACTQRFAPPPTPPRPGSAQPLRSLLDVQRAPFTVSAAAALASALPGTTERGFACSSNSLAPPPVGAVTCTAHRQHQDAPSFTPDGALRCETLGAGVSPKIRPGPPLSSSSSLPTAAPHQLPTHGHGHQQQPAPIVPLVSWVVEVFHAHKYDATLSGDTKALLFSTRLDDVRPLPTVSTGAVGWGQPQPLPQPMPWTYSTVQEYFLSLVTAERCFLKSLLYLDPEFQEFVMFTPKTVQQILQASRVRALVVPMLKEPPPKLPPHCDAHASPTGFMACAHERMPTTLLAAPHPPARATMLSPRRPEHPSAHPHPPRNDASDGASGGKPAQEHAASTCPPQRRAVSSMATATDGAATERGVSATAATTSEVRQNRIDDSASSMAAAVEQRLRDADATNRLERLDDIWQREEFAMDLFMAANAARDRMLEAQLQEAIERTEEHGISNRALASMLKFEDPHAWPQPVGDSHNSEAETREASRQRHADTVRSNGHRHYQQSSVLRAALDHAFPKYAAFASTPEDKATIRSWLADKLLYRLVALESADTVGSASVATCSTPELVERLVADVTAPVARSYSENDAALPAAHDVPEELRRRMREELLDQRRQESLRQDAEANRIATEQENRARASVARVSEARVASQRAHEANEAALRAADAQHQLEATKREVQEKDAALRALTAQLDALREAEKQEHARREQEARITGRREREAARRELDALEAAQREAEAREVAWREVEARELTRREVDAREAARELERQQIAKREAHAREAAWRALEAREAALREAEARETARRELEAHEAAQRAIAARDAARREQEARDAAQRAQDAQDAARKELEAREAARRALDTQDAARRELEAKEAARREEEARQASKHEEEARDSVRRALAARKAREAKRQKMEVAKRELDAREAALREEEASLAAQRALTIREAEEAQKQADQEADEEGEEEPEDAREEVEDEEAEEEEDEEEQEPEAEEEEEDEEADAAEEEEEVVPPPVKQEPHDTPQTRRNVAPSPAATPPEQRQAGAPGRHPATVITAKVSNQEMERMAEAFDFPLTVVKGAVIECRGDALRVTERLERASAERCAAAAPSAMLPANLTHGTAALVAKITRMIGNGSDGEQGGGADEAAAVQALNEAKGNARTALELLVERDTHALPQHLAVQITLDKMNREYEAKRALHKLKVEEGAQQAASAADAAVPPTRDGPCSTASPDTGATPPPEGPPPAKRNGVRPTSAAAALRITTVAAPSDDGTDDDDDAVFEIDDDDDDEELQIDDEDDEEEARPNEQARVPATEAQVKSPWIEHVVEPMVSSAVGAYLSRTSSMVSAAS